MKIILKRFSVFVFLILYSVVVFSMEASSDKEINLHGKIFIEIKNLHDDSIKKRISTIQERMEKEKWEDGNYANKAKGLLGEAASIAIFQKIGYASLTESVKLKIKRMEKNIGIDDLYEGKQCTSKKGPDNGIDGIFINQYSNELPAVIINEAKFRGSNRESLRESDFGWIKKNKIQQSSSKWNQLRLHDIACYKKYNTLQPARTATLLNNKGELSLYGITDKNQELSTNSNTLKILKTYVDNQQDLYLQTTDLDSPIKFLENLF